MQLKYYTINKWHKLLHDDCSADRVLALASLIVSRVWARYGYTQPQLKQNEWAMERSESMHYINLDVDLVNYG